MGTVFVYAPEVSCVIRREVPREEIEAEIARYLSAWTSTEKYYQLAVDEAARDLGKEEAEILKSHLEILRDPYFTEELPTLIRSEHANAEWFVSEGVRRISATLAESPNPYLRERAVDVEDVGRQLVHRLLQLEWVESVPHQEPVVVVARELTPSDVLRLRGSPVLAMVTELGTATSHAAVIAKPLGVPVVMGVPGLSQLARRGDTVFVDGSTGTVYLNPDPASREVLAQRIHEAHERDVRIKRDVHLPAFTRDGVRIHVVANIADPEETRTAIESGAEGVGLFRSEFVFLKENRLLDEEEQLAIYRAVVEGMGGLPVVIRTLDLGGDKLVPHHERQPEANPFLGWRSIRISLQMREGFRTQIRSILRASLVGPTHILFPMVSTVDEVIEVNQVLEEVIDALKAEGFAGDFRLPRGIMIEVPSAAVNIRAFLPHADFVSIGTNDLIQYTLAVDRSNPRVASYYRPCDPAVLRLIRHTAWTAHRFKKRVAVCGEMAGTTRYVPLLIGLGVEELSMTPSAIPAAKHLIRKICFSDASALAHDALGCATASEVDHLVDEFIHTKTGNG